MAARALKKNEAGGSRGSRRIFGVEAAARCLALWGRSEVCLLAIPLVQAQNHMTPVFPLAGGALAWNEAAPQGLLGDRG